MDIRRLLPIGVIVLLAMGLAACSKTANTDEMPKDLKTVIDEQLKETETFALTLDGEFGDWHEAMMESGQRRNYEGYAAHLEVLKRFREEIGAYYVYTFYTDKKNAESYTIAMDASDKPDEFGSPYDTDPSFITAWGGTASATKLGWNNKQNDPVWGTFAPITNSEGKVVALLGVDKPQPLVNKYPQFNEHAS